MPNENSASAASAQATDTSVKFEARPRGFLAKLRAAPPIEAIDDDNFFDLMEEIFLIRSTILEAGIKLATEDEPLLSFGSLMSLRPSRSGRAPTKDEWAAVELRLQKFSHYMTTDLWQRLRIRTGRTAGIISVYPMWLIALAMMALIAAIASVGFLPTEWIRAARFVAYLMWMVCLGAVGAIAFVSVNALSIQKDVTFDWTEKRLLHIRIVLGALFGVVLSMPFGFESFFAFCDSIASAAVTGSQSRALAFGQQAVLLILPFVLGFSTSLVMLILNRFVEAVGVFFGQRQDSKTAEPPTNSEQRQNAPEHVRP